MVLQVILFLFFGLITATTSAAEVAGEIQVLGVDQHSLEALRIGEIYLNERVTVPTRTGQFSFKLVEDGEYTLSFYIPEYQFEVYQIVVKNGDVKAHLSNPLLPESKFDVNHPLKVRPTNRISYLAKRVPWSPMSLFKNPMMLMMIFMGVMAFGLPKMMENLDPEILEEIKRGQAGQSGTPMAQVNEGSSPHSPSPNAKKSIKTSKKRNK